jgi:UDP-N-acetylmuramate dehydrogenase
MRKSHHNDIVIRLKATMKGEVRRNVSMAPWTAYRIGGPAAIWAAPETEADVGRALAVFHDTGLPCFILGRGTNLLVSDHGWDGAVLYLGDNLSGCRFENTRADALAGMPLVDLVREAVARGLGGMERLAGIPGSVGGALIMNAGAFGQEIEASVTRVRGFDMDGAPFHAERGDLDFQYRRVPDLAGRVVTGGDFTFTPGDSPVLEDTMQRTLARRASRQPLSRPSCGSVFKRPTGHYAGALIEAAGLKGTRAGDAMISPKHAGFIVNMKTASADDVYALICRIERRVEARFGVRLEREVKLLGRFGDKHFGPG